MALNQHYSITKSQLNIKGIPKTFPNIYSHTLKTRKKQQQFVDKMQMNFILLYI